MATNKLSDQLKADYPEIPWSQIKGFRNIAFHTYSHINGHEVIRILQKELPDLKIKLEEILETITVDSNLGEKSEKE